MNAPPLQLGDPGAAAIIAAAHLADVLPEVARCTCELCNPMPLHAVWREHARAEAIREAAEALRAGAPGQALEVLEAAL
jgi:hypothetical protein